MSDETAPRKKARRVPLTVCENGHVTATDESRAEEAWMIRCPGCGDWTWEDGNFCGRCGKRLEVEEKPDE